MRGVYGKGSITDRAARNLFVKFQSGETSFNNELKAGHPSYFDDNLLKVILKQNLQQSTRAIVGRLNTSQSLLITTWRMQGISVNWKSMGTSQSLRAECRRSHASSHKSVFTDKNQVFCIHSVIQNKKLIKYENIVYKRQ